MNRDTFREIVWSEGAKLFRPMPWRDNTDPYFILVSELMLQQTQVDRVIPKFNAFITAFPTVTSLANAQLSDVLTLWSGLGYNRRAKYLHDAAKTVVSNYRGGIPDTYKELVSLPGVGPNTAGAILAYGFNQPALFIETNVRTVYFYHLFPDSDTVSDAELRAVVEETADTEHPREWYWAVMDYGAFLKRHGAGQLTKSKHYKKQPPLKGSLREVRGMILKHLTRGPVDEAVLRDAMPDDERFDKALLGLEADGLVVKDQKTVRLLS